MLGAAAAAAQRLATDHTPALAYARPCCATEALQETLAQESESEGVLCALPFHWLEVSHLLLHKYVSAQPAAPSLAPLYTCTHTHGMTTQGC